MSIEWPAELEHRSLTRPALSDPLWRYMDFTKFVAMLVNQGLYLARLDRLGDTHEGWIPKLPRKHYDGFFAQSNMERDRELRKQSRNLRKQFYVSCWHANNEQSDAMWKLYQKGSDGIAIRTTSRNLQSSLESTSEELWLYQVEYADSGAKPNHGGSMLRACMTKRTPFMHEKEVRLLWRDTETPMQSRQQSKSGGFYIKCNLATLIEKVYIAPTEKPWLGPIVKDILNKYGLRPDVEQSGLSLKPK